MYVLRKLGRNKPNSATLRLFKSLYYNTDNSPCFSLKFSYMYS